MLSIDEILDKAVEDSEAEVASESTVTPEDKVVFQENISNELAKELLEANQFDDACHYQIVTLTNCTILLKIDDRVPEDCNDGLNKHITEYCLSTEDEVMTYEQMMKSILIPNSVTSTNDYKNLYTKPKNTFICVWVTLLTILLLIGLGLFYVYFKYLV